MTHESMSIVDSVTQSSRIIKIGTATILKGLLKQNSTTAKTTKQNSRVRIAVHQAAQEGFDAVKELFDKKEKEIIATGQTLEEKSPGALLAEFSAPVDEYENNTKLAYGALIAAKKLKIRYV